MRNPEGLGLFAGDDGNEAEHQVYGMGGCALSRGWARDAIGALLLAVNLLQNRQ